MKVHISPDNLGEYIGVPLTFYNKNKDQESIGFLVAKRKGLNRAGYLFVMSDPSIGWLASMQNEVSRVLEQYPHIKDLLGDPDYFSAWHMDVDLSSTEYYLEELGVWCFSSQHIPIYVEVEEKEKVIKGKFRWRKRK